MEKVTDCLQSERNPCVCSLCIFKLSLQFSEWQSQQPSSKKTEKQAPHTSLQMNWLSNSQKNTFFPSDLRWRELLTWSSALQRHHVPQPSSGPQVPQFDRPIVRAGQDQATTELQARHRRLVLVGTWKVRIITPWPLTSTSCLYMSSLSSQRYHFMHPFLYERQHVHLDITWFHWVVNSHIESFPPSLALKYLLLKIFTAGQISKKKKKREITWTFTVPENKVQYHWQRVQFFIQSPKTLETTHIPFSCTFWLNPCGSNCPHMWAEQMNSKRCEIHNHKRLNRPSQTLHESILRTRSNKHPVVCFISHESDHSSGSLSASDLNMIIHVISEPLQCPLFPHFLPAGCGLLSQPVLLPSQRSGAEVPRRPSPSSCSHCLIGQIPSKGRYQLLTLQRVETLSCPDVPHSHRGVGIPGNQDVVSKLHAAGQRLVARQRVDTPTWTRDTRLA